MKEDFRPEWARQAELELCKRNISKRQMWANLGVGVNYNRMIDLMKGYSREKNPTIETAVRAYIAKLEAGVNVV